MRGGWFRRRGRESWFRLARVGGVVNVNCDRVAVARDNAGGDLVEGVASLVAAGFKFSDCCCDQGRGLRAFIVTEKSILIENDWP